MQSILRPCALLPAFVALLIAGSTLHAEPLSRPTPATADPHGRQEPASPAMPVLPAAEADPVPLYAPGTFERTAEAYRFYERLQAEGGWQSMDPRSAGLKPGDRGGLVAALKTRLSLEGDLDSSSDSVFDAALETALKRFQRRHGLSETGRVGRLTLKALEVPIATRLNQLAASLHRLKDNGFKFADRYVVVNIPGAAVEAVEDGKVVQRHVAVVGRPDRPSPVLQARIQAVNLNPTWTAPASVVKADIVPKVRADHAFLFKNNMRVLNAAGAEVDPNTVDWSGKHDPTFMLRQDGGPGNALGQVRIDMPNTLAVYMHDTPKQELFRSDVRFHSSGCARVEGVRDLAVWLLRDLKYDRATLDAAIASGERTDLKLPKPVPVAWVYLTGWAAGDGTIQFRDDIYGLDTAEGLTTSTIRARPPKATPERPAKPGEIKPDQTKPAQARPEPTKPDQQARSASSAARQP